MWPERGEALSRTIDAEAAVADLYAEALRRWAPDARAAVLPTLAARLIASGGSFNGDPNAPEHTLPPDPDALAQTQTSWDSHAGEVILAGLLMLWAVSYVEAAAGLGITLPLLPIEAGAKLAVDAAALKIITRTTDASATQIREWTAQVQQSAPAQAAVADFIDTQRPDVAAVPGIVREHLAVAEREAEALAVRDPGSATPVQVVESQRAAVAAALDPSSPELRDVARREGYQAAGVMNDAVITAAAASDDADELEKTWIATLDAKTRPTHWAADGQRVPLAGKFTIGGELMDCPGDETASIGEWINCRCRVGVLAKDEKLPNEVDRHTERLNGRDSVAINRDGRTQAEEIERRREAGNTRARDEPDGIGRVASAAPNEQEHDMKVKPSHLARTTLAAADADNGSDNGDGVDDNTYVTFTDAIFAVTGIPTSDGRMLASDIALEFRDTPMPLQWCEEMEGGHYGSVTVGVIESITLAKGEIRGSGYMLNNENALKAIDLVSHGVCNPSIDSVFEIVYTYEDGTVVTEENFDPDLPMFETAIKGEVLATTIVAIPAFGETRIALNAEREPRDTAMVAALVASMSTAHKPPVYDPALFADPKLSGPTRLTITEDGHVFGHIASWKDQHRSVGLGNIKPPRSETGYEHFHSSPGVQLTDGSTLPVGRLTVGIGHAPTSGVSSAAAQAHYDNVEACWAIGRICEDRHGIVFSGVAAPWASPEKVQMGLASPLSGDWRPIGPKRDNLELVAVLSVNTPGFLCKAETDGRGQQLAMVASLGLPPGTESGGITHLSLGDIKAAVAEALAESAHNAELAHRREAALALARETVGDPPRELTPNERVEQLLAEVGQ